MYEHKDATNIQPLISRSPCRPAKAATRRHQRNACMHACVASRRVVSKATVSGVDIVRRCTVLSWRTVTARDDRGRGERKRQRRRYTTATHTEGSHGESETEQAAAERLGGQEGKREKRETVECELVVCGEVLPAGEPAETES